MKERIRIWLSLFVVASLVLTFSACSSPQTAAETSEPASPVEESGPTEASVPAQGTVESNVLKVGIDGPYTGPAALSGQEFRGSAEIAFDEINWQIGSYKIEPVWIDDQSDPAKATQAYEQAVVQDGIQVGILNWNSSVAVALMEVTAKYKIPHIASMGATELVNETFRSDPEKYGYWTCKWWPTADKLIGGYVETLEGAIASGRWSPESKTVAIYGEDTDWGRSFGKAMKEQLEAAGWEVVNEEYFPIDQADFYPWLNKLSELNPALIAGTHTGAAAFSGLVKQADELGLKAVIIADGLGRFGEWYDLTGDSSNYVLDQIAPAFRSAEGEAYVKEFEKRYGFTPSASAGGLAYDGTRFFIAIAQAVYEETGTLNSETISKFIKEKVWTGEWSFKDGIVMENYQYSPESIPDPIVGAGYYTFPIVQYMDGEAKTVYPPNLADAEFMPKP
jgi:branched-chain amino acid transport system substrate-binding protein